MKFSKENEEDDDGPKERGRRAQTGSVRSPYFTRSGLHCNV